MAKILIVDDEEDFRITTGTMLSLKVHTVIYAQDGIQALESIRINSPDVVLCDIDMPKLKGFDVLSELRKDPTISSIPIIFLTGKHDISYMVRAMHLNVDDFLNKPFDSEDLFRVINIQLKKVYTRSQ